ncbi:MAG: polysaccharide biosynthesis tyrosine autokinase, partial [Gammaproteobacteria bacterium]|nr:polysaccharide biosynthesis tyrosine autokinase [Gammaproteobacteria bacterium]
MNIIEKAVDRLAEEEPDVPGLNDALVGQTVGVRLRRRRHEGEDGLTYVNELDAEETSLPDQRSADDPLPEPSSLKVSARPEGTVEAEPVARDEPEVRSAATTAPRPSLDVADDTDVLTPQEVLAGAASITARHAVESRQRERGGRHTVNEIEVDLKALRKSGFVTPESVDSLMGEQHRIIKRPLLMKATRGGAHWVDRGNLVLVTSSLPNEGKTFISTNLAMSIASEVDRTVLLIDADVVKGDVSRVFGLRDRPGLSTFLRGEAALPDLLYKTNIPSLSVLPAGPRAKNLTELFASAQMERFTEELSERYPERVVIFDSAPLLATSGTNVLVNLVGQVVFVIEAVRTPQHVVRDALETISGHPSVGAVLNKSRFSERSRYHYYGYYAPG